MPLMYKTSKLVVSVGASKTKGLKLIGKFFIRKEDFLLTELRLFHLRGGIDLPLNGRV